MIEPVEAERISALLVDCSPTLTAAVGCDDCLAIMRTADNHRCRVCGSEAVFDLTRLLNRVSDGRL